MQYRKAPAHHRYSFNSLAELGRYIGETPRKWKSASSEGPSSGDSWDLNASFKDAVTMAKDGWLEGAKRAAELLKVFPPQSPEPDTKTDFYGHMPHVPRYCAGAPDSMIRHHKAPTMGGGRVLTLYVPVNALAGVRAQYMANFGCGVAQYVNQLETSGIRVELYGMIVSEVSRQRVAHTWLIKRADQPLDLAVVAFSIGHPAMFRRLGFALRERSDVPQDSAYGRTVPAEYRDLINAPAGAYILNGMAQADRHARTAKDALEYIRKNIDKALEERANQ